MALIATFFLAAQAAAYYGLPKERAVNLLTPLAAFPAHINGWSTLQEITVEKDVGDVLKADEILSRYYGLLVSVS